MLSTKEVVSATNEKETTTFRKLLLTRCQKEFEKDNNAIVLVESKKKELESAETVTLTCWFMIKFLQIQYMQWMLNKLKPLCCPIFVGREKERVNRRIGRIDQQKSKKVVRKHKVISIICY